MDVKYSHCLEVIQYEGKTIVCQIRVVPRFVNYYHGQTHPVKTHRWMQSEHWAAFDDGIRRCFREMGGSGASHTTGAFQLNALIRVHVRPLSTPVDILRRCIDWRELGSSAFATALECCIEYHDQGKWTGFEEPPGECGGSVPECEYEPQFVGKSPGELALYIGEHFAPYTPSAVLFPLSSDDRCDGEVDPKETDHSVFEPYSPKPVAHAGDTHSPHETFGDITPVPVYSASYIAKSVLEKIPENEEARMENSEKLRGVKRRGRKTNLRRGRRSSEDTERIESDLIDQFFAELRDSTENDEREVDVALNTGRRTPQSPHFTKEQSITSNDSSKESEIARNVTLRRRSKSVSPTYGTRHTTAVHKHLFGSEDEEENSRSASKNIRKARRPKLVSTPTSSSTRVQTKRKRQDLKSEGERERQLLSNWLGKKSPSPKCSPRSLGSAQKASPRKPSVPIAYLTEEEMRIQRQRDMIQLDNNKKLQLLVRSSQTQPKKVNFLSLTDLPTEQLLDSFDTHRQTLDRLYIKHRKEKSHRGGVKGVDHFLVIDLLEQEKQLEMMNKLRAAYEANAQGPSPNALLYANVLLPEWIVCIFEEKFSFSRAEAQKQLRDQYDYKLHLEVLSDNSS